MSRSITALLLMLLAACCTPPVAPQQVDIAPGVTFILPQPSGLGRDIEATQLVTARHGDEVFLFEGRLSVTAARILLAGSDMLGRKVMTIRWDGTTLSADRAVWLPDRLRPENVLADIMLMYWPDQALRQAVFGASLDNAGERRLFKDGEAIVTVAHDGDPWNGMTTLRNLPWHYEINVRSAMVTP